MSLLRSNWLHRFAVLTALMTLGLVGIGGLVTSHGVGMAVPDWPTSYGYNMFALPFSTWFTGGVFHEHTHRLWASWVGVLVVALTRWLGGSKARLPLTLVGIGELIAGFVLLKLGPDWQGAGHFLMGIGGVVALAGIVWARNASAVKPLPLLGWLAFVAVQVQGLLGGLRVVLDAQVIADVRLGMFFGLLHAFLAQAFLVLLCVIALFTSSWWKNFSAEKEKTAAPGGLQTFAMMTTVLILVQLALGAAMRHQHAGLAIPDFPLAYGKIWPATDPESIVRYNQQRLEITAANPITAAQVVLQMVHRIVAAGIFAGVAWCFWRARRELGRQNALSRVATIWLSLIAVQIGLGAWTIWSNKAADIATAHVVVGALSLVTGALWCIIANRRFSRNSSAATVAINELSPDALGATSAAINK